MENKIEKIKKEITFLYSSMPEGKERQRKKISKEWKEIQKLETELKRLEIIEIKKSLRKPEPDKVITCYFCKKTKGIAKEILRVHSKSKKDKNGKVIKGKDGKNKLFRKWGWTWHAKDFKMIGNDFWLCFSCDKTRRCRAEGCGILLSNDIICPACATKHGAFYPKHPYYCKGCWDKRSNKKHDSKR